MNPFEKSLLQFYTKKQLEKIQSIKIGIGGAGGLGSNLASLLVRSGFKNLEIIDNDKIEASNLNRQQYFLDEIGKNKIEILNKHLLKINPDLVFKGSSTTWTTENANQFFEHRDIIVECFDKAADKAAFLEYYQDRTKYLVSGNGMAGLDFDKPLVTKRIGNIFIIGDQETEVGGKNPPITSRVMLCASMMAEMVLKITFHEL